MPAINTRILSALLGGCQCLAMTFGFHLRRCLPLLRPRQSAVPPSALDESIFRLGTEIMRPRMRRICDLGSPARVFSFEMQAPGGARGGGLPIEILGARPRTSVLGLAVARPEERHDRHGLSTARAGAPLLASARRLLGFAGACENNSSDVGGAAHGENADPAFDKQPQGRRG